MSKVYIVNDGNHTYDSAKRFGELVTITDRNKGVNVFAIDNLVKEIKEKLVNSMSNDYVLISGYPILNSIVIHYFLKKFGKVLLLQWEGNNRKYKVITLLDWEV